MDLAEHKKKLDFLLQQSGIPSYMHESIVEYIVNGRPVGAFLRSLLCGNLFETFARADENNKKAIENYVRFFSNSIFSSCYGSEEKVKNWIETKGMRGL